MTTDMVLFSLCCLSVLAFSTASSVYSERNANDDDTKRTRERRSDDSTVQSLQMVVETLSQKVTTLTAEMDALKAASETEKRAMEGKLTSLLAKQSVMFLENNRVVFRITAGSGISAYRSYMTGCNSACAATGGTLTQDRHFRSIFLDLWPSCLIDTVRVSLLEHGMENAFVEFNGRGSTKTSWFSLDRVVNSSWTDLRTAPHNFFSIEGDVIAGNRDRRFFIERNYGGCGGDVGWLLVVDGQDPCKDSWAAGALPVILYSRGSTAATENNAAELAHADELTITVKLRSDISLNQDYCTL